MLNIKFLQLTKKPGEIFIPKAPASNIKYIANALIKIFSSKSKIKYIGTRHGEKLFETLISSEEMLFSKNLKKYYKIISDHRDLNYNKYFTQGNISTNQIEPYTSHNTYQLNQNEVEKILLKLDYIKSMLYA